VALKEVRCPECRTKLFMSGAVGPIEIKCKCGRVVTIILK
jgi:phage FluMu protein Com